MPLSAKVKAVLSGDTVVLIPPRYNKPTPPAERVLTLSSIRAPSGNEPGAFEAREFLRTLLLGKEVQFTTVHKSASGHEFGDLHAPVFALLAHEVVSKGWAKVKDNVEDESLAEAEAAAATAHRGLHDPQLARINVEELFDTDVVARSQRSPIATIVERVISGDRVVVRMLVGKTRHVVCPVLIAGIRAPRTDSEDPNGPVAKYFVELRLLLRDVKVAIAGVLQQGVFLARIQHPAGNIAEKVVEAGLAEVSDWQLSIVGVDGMAVLRKAEAAARSAGLGVWKSTSATPRATGSALAPGKTLTLTVHKVVLGDTLVVRDDADKEHTVQLALVKAPRPLDPATSAWVARLREFVRKLAIGRLVLVYVDAIRSPNEKLGLEERPLVSITVGTASLLESLLAAGLALVVHHLRATADERAALWDRLVEVEGEAVAAKKGIHSGKPPAPERPVDASENAAKAKTFFNQFSKGKSAGVVEYVSGASRYKLSTAAGPKLTLVLGGLTGQGAAEGAVAFANRKVLQRDVQFDVYDTDKTGAFVGNLYLQGQREPFQVNLLSQGLVKLHGGAVRDNAYAAVLQATEEKAKEAHKGVWADYTPEAAVETTLAKVLLEKQFYDVIVTEVSYAEKGAVYFQIDDAKVRGPFKQLNAELQEFNQKPAVLGSVQSAELGTSPVALSTPPKKNEYVCVKYENGKWYRGRVVLADRKTNQYEVQHIDYGNVDTVGLADLRVLPKRFLVGAMPKQAHKAVLQGVRLPPSTPTDYLAPALDALDALTDTKVAVAATPVAGGDVDYEVVAYDASKIGDVAHSINRDLVAAGWGIVTSTDAGLREAERAAKRERKGCWEYGDVEFDE